MHNNFFQCIYMQINNNKHVQLLNTVVKKEKRKKGHKNEIRERGKKKVKMRHQHVQKNPTTIDYFTAV